jgi:hypothetical protein
MNTHENDNRHVIWSPSGHHLRSLGKTPELRLSQMLPRRQHRPSPTISVDCRSHVRAALGELDAVKVRVRRTVETGVAAFSGKAQFEPVSVNERLSP